ncbi:MAG: peptidylprolyl isomerase [Gammaproteobacteria bacterium]
MPVSIIGRDTVVALTYTLRNQKGEVVEIHDLPVSYVHGSGADLFPKIERALDGKTIGDVVTIELTPEESFGHPDPKLRFTEDMENAPKELHRVGTQFEAQNAKGESITLTVTRIEDGKITVDANHPLAGQTVTFQVTVRDIRPATPEEVRLGRPQRGGPMLQ